MIHVKVLKNGVVKFENPNCVDQAAADEWVQSQEDIKAFGDPAWVEIIPAVVDEQGNELEAEQQINHPADYVVLYEPIVVDPVKVAWKARIDLRQVKQGVGAEVVAIATEINDDKNYTGEQLNAFMADTLITTIERLAWSGSLDLLKASIQSYSGSFYNAADKNLMIAPIDAFFASQV